MCKSFNVDTDACSVCAVTMKLPATKLTVPAIIIVIIMIIIIIERK